VKCFNLLWRGSHDGFGATECHLRCDRVANTLKFIVDTNWSVFGGFALGEMGVRGTREVQRRRQPGHFPFHAEESGCHPGAEMCVEGAKEATRNLRQCRMWSTIGRLLHCYLQELQPKRKQSHLLVSRDVQQREETLLTGQ
jgi:hypothetical protein